MNDPHNLRRFVDAQESIYDQVLSELRGGRKRSHWMWFIFPQIKGLGSSETSRRFAISSRSEASAYMLHPILGARLRACTTLVNQVEGRSVYDIFGSPDDMKLHSCMTLFAAVAGDDRVFRQVLDKYFAGRSDSATVARL